MPIQILTAIIHREKRFYVAECREVGTISQGMTKDEAYKNLKEATELYLKEFPQIKFPKQKTINFEGQNIKPNLFRALMMVVR